MSRIREGHGRRIARRLREKAERERLYQEHMAQMAKDNAKAIEATKQIKPYPKAGWGQRHG